MNYQLPSLVTLLTVVLQLAMMMVVGRARGKYGVAVPATTGHPGFEAAFRVQMNTIESTLMFLPALWVFAIYTSTLWAGILGGIWLLGRVAYAVGYLQEPGKRSMGFLIGFAAISVLVLGGFYGLIRTGF